ncbi:condensin-2 complex subunit H2 isoform X1 [Triplophysa rosa]|uniref:condensin-2 complex subunit H2 isoform X1 n=1 Tax=Triplophysa rosa TaxID=992332 RepID=UPI002545CF3D|nr:condensin-2 complex subunit H2 isoform X1 [Triplophysa rosa]XP_057179989.1 condensin-2 complex subunit H2 isoform X1 [Triplophysa rosa]XP_057179990.1 condensin-2 complex subunit H2 isoform X1 [Triplophysa rosa]
MDSAETRYAHLLQPLRDLTKNWDIDLASQLGEYLDELDQMTISFDGGKTMMNFAEAALLIQGSTCIYGRKVELLHTLVFQTLDYISNKNKKHDKQGSSADGNQGKASAHNEEDDCEFDEIEQNENVNSVNLTMKDPTEPVKIIRLPPESLIPAESLEKQKYPLFSLKGEILGSCKDYRINNFSMDEIGLMRLGSSHTNLHKDVSENQYNMSVHAPPVHLETEGVAEVGGGHDDDDGDAEVLPPLEDHGMEVESEEWVERHQEAPSEGRTLRPRPQIQPVTEEPKKLKEIVDPWKWHDSYAAFGEDKPLKTGKCCKVPAGLEESGKRKRKGPSKLQDFGSWYSKAFETADRKLKNGPTYPDLNYIFVSKMGQRLKVQKQILRTRGVFVSDEELKKTFLEPENLEGQIEEVLHADAGGEDFSDHEHDNLVDELEPAEHLGEPEHIFQDLHMSRMSYEDLVKKSVDLFLVNSQKYAQETALSRRVKEWEDGINPHLAAQETRPVFDIHEYGDRIVQALSNVGVKKSFAFVVKGKENTEACRYMLAALQLANDYTVEIDKGEGLEECVDTMELTLLTTQRAHERLKTYNAPSATDTP